MSPADGTGAGSADTTIEARDRRDGTVRERVFPVFRRLERRGYFGFHVHGAAHVPRTGRVVFASNHAGWFPLDGYVLLYALHEHVDPGMHPCTATVDVALRAPILGDYLARSGGVPASWFRHPDRLPQWLTSLAIFPEGTDGNVKPFWHAYRMRPWKQGFARFALALGATIVPVAILGGEESLPVATGLHALRPLLRTPLPIPLAAVPLPARWEIVFHAPIVPPAVGSEDHGAVARELAQRAQAVVQATLDERTRDRPLGRLGRWTARR